jgi:hypothetical protein
MYIFFLEKMTCMFVCEPFNQLHSRDFCLYKHGIYTFWLVVIWQKHKKHSKEVVPTSCMEFFIYRHILWWVLGYALGTVLHMKYLGLGIHEVPSWIRLFCQGFLGPSLGISSYYIFLHQLTEFCVISRWRNEFRFIGYLQISPNGQIQIVYMTAYL